MEKKTGTAASLVAPAPPTEPLEADDADPGQVEEAKAAQKESKTGKYGSVPAQPFTPAGPPEQWQGKETTWIGVELVDEQDKPITGELCHITVPDGRVYKGSTDQHGKVRIDGFEAGDCKITFPRFDREAWEAA